MEIVERILAKVVGEELSKEELELTSGGIIDRCASYPPEYITWEAGWESCPDM